MTATLVSSIAAGAYNAQVAAIDAAGNKGKYSTPVAVMLDKTAPAQVTGVRIITIQITVTP